MIKIFFCGTPEIAIPTLKKLHSNKKVKIISVVSMPSRPKGRGKNISIPPIAKYAIDNNINLIQTENINKERKLIKLIKNIDMVIVMAFSQFLSKEILNAPKIGCFNIHTSILPKYRGTSPIQYAILNDDCETGITIQKMQKKMDSGDIVINKKIEITPQDDYLSLSCKLMNLSAQAIDEFIMQAVNNKIKYTPQKESEATFTKPIKKEDGFIDFTKESFTTIQRKIKAFASWPGIYCFLNNKRTKILSIQEAKQIELDKGIIKIIDNKIFVGCKDSTIRITMLQMEGKNKCSDYDLINGLKNKYDEILINK